MYYYHNLHQMTDDWEEEEEKALPICMSTGTALGSPPHLTFSEEVGRAQKLDPKNFLLRVFFFRSCTVAR